MQETVGLWIAGTNTLKIHTRQGREVESHKTHILENGGSNPPPAINLVGITLSVYRRSMIRLNLSHEKRLLLILLSGVRTEKHNGM